MATTSRTTTKVIVPDFDFLIPSWRRTLLAENKAERTLDT